jgi:hypothetical protein
MSCDDFHAHTGELMAATTVCHNCLFSDKTEDRLTGSGGPDQSEQYPRENGKIDGDRMRFELTTRERSFT